MRKTAIAITMAGAVLIAASPVLAADNAAALSQDDSLKLCAKLSDQYDFLKPFKKGLPYWQKADAEFQTGATDCANGQAVDGAHAMRTAIRDLYVKPETL